MFAASDFLDFSRTAHAALFAEVGPVWGALNRIAPYLAANLRPGIEGEVAGSAHIGEAVFMGKGTRVEPGATILGPAWIGENCVIRAGAYLRENVITGDGCTLGNSCEFKNCLLFDEVEVPHFSYVGDAIMGHRAHLGAGVILSNVRLNREEVHVRDGAGTLPTGLRKFSAIIGDHAEIGCNSVVSPGSIIGRHCVLYPGTHWNGVLPENRIVKVRQSQQIVERLPFS
jgi:NDP-sugar pyrophosphorylase family protein